MAERPWPAALDILNDVRSTRVATMVTELVLGHVLEGDSENIVAASKYLLASGEGVRHYEVDDLQRFAETIMDIIAQGEA